MARTKIVATLGPASRSTEMITSLILAGADVFRVNMSHGDHATHAGTIQMIRDVSAKLRRPAAILCDLSGPKIRIGTIAPEPVILEPGKPLIIKAEEVVGNATEISTNWPGLFSAVAPGQHILLDDGLLELRVERVDTGKVHTTVVRGGPLSSHKGLNLPNTSIEIPAMSDKDCADMQFGLENDADMFAISFVKHARDITEARTHMQKLGGELPLIAKIEKHEAVANLEEIVREADGAMVARGDLGVEIPVEQVPLVQKRVIALCNSLGKPVITATQMLDSMIRSPRPTRAEVTDVANAIFDGSDAIMLSGETAIGKFPLQAVEIMNRIAETSEEAVDYEGLLRKTMISQVGSVPDAISHATATIAHDLNLRYIVCLTHYGSTPRMIARYRPHSEILVYALSRRTAQQLCLTWGVRSTSADFLDKAACPTPGDSAAHLKAAIAAFKQQGVLKSGDLVALASGVALHQPGTTNMIEVLRVS